jgi:hypothetical protein
MTDLYMDTFDIAIGRSVLGFMLPAPGTTIDQVLASIGTMAVDPGIRQRCTKYEQQAIVLAREARRQMAGRIGFPQTGAYAMLPVTTQDGRYEAVGMLMDFDMSIQAFVLVPGGAIGHPAACEECRGLSASMN